jgi:hypothetical protein
VLFFPLVFLGLGAVYYSYGQARNRGYRAPSAAALLIASWAGVTTVVYELAPASLAHRTDNLGISGFILYSFWLPVLLSTAFCLALIHLFPQRNARRFGARRVRIPFLRLGQIVLGMAILLAALSLLALIPNPLDYSGSLTGFSVACFIGILGAYLLRLGRRAKPPISQAIQLGADAPVGALYLRSFKQESEPFAIVPREKFKAYAMSWAGSADDGYGNVHLPFEQYFEKELNEKLGTFVALGSPEDYLAPEGAMRIYAKDTDWTEWVQDFAKRAKCILVEYGRSENLCWEFEHLRHEGLQQKLFVLTQPSHRDARFSWAVRNTLSRLKGIRPVQWREFSRDLDQLGYSLDFQDPGAGCVIVFDENGQGVLLATESELPPDYVQPICDWLGGRNPGNSRSKRDVHPVSKTSVCHVSPRALPGHAYACCAKRGSLALSECWGSFPPFFGASSACCCGWAPQWHPRVRG